jgi:succinate dehydrogenase/fumarate reductase flavoprotein subunit
LELTVLIEAVTTPMPNGDTVKKALYRQLRRARLLISNRYMATRLLIGPDNRIAGVIAVNTRTAEFLVVRAKAVILCMGAAGRLGLPTSGYMFGTYENAANSGDGYAMAYHAGAKLANLECSQINPLIKDCNGPACAYVAGPFGAYTANSEGNRFIECDYWSGQMILEFYNELQSGKGPVFLRLDHCRRSPDVRVHLRTARPAAVPRSYSTLVACRRRPVACAFSRRKLVAESHRRLCCGTGSTST